jgi:hypothetical protein
MDGVVRGRGCLVAAGWLACTCRVEAKNSSYSYFWILPVRESSGVQTSGEAAMECSLPLVPRKGVTEYSRLFVENKDTRLASEADFPHLPVLADQQ